MADGHLSEPTSMANDREDSLIMPLTFAVLVFLCVIGIGFLTIDVIELIQILQRSIGKGGA